MDGFFYSGLLGLFSILTNELGDRTFLLTTLFCSQNSFWKVFPACMSALLLNCIGSIAFGRFLLPLLLGAVIINILSFFLLFISGLWMVWNALRKLIVQIEYQESESSESQKEIFYDEDYMSFFRIFLIIFLAELGDRSQLATFALSTSHVRTKPLALVNYCLEFLGHSDWNNLWSYDLYTFCLFGWFSTFSKDSNSDIEFNWWYFIYNFGNFAVNLWLRVTVFKNSNDILFARDKHPRLLKLLFSFRNSGKFL